MGDLERFSAAERRLHWTTAVAVGILALTGALIWQQAAKWDIAGVNVIERAHVWLGAPLLIGGLLGFARKRGPRVPYADQRFSRGQHLGLRLVQVLLLGMIVSGCVFYLREFVTMAKPLRQLLRQVHFWTAVPLVAFVVVHLQRVLVHRGLLAGMLTGRVSRDAAWRISPDWVASLDDDRAPRETDPLHPKA